MSEYELASAPISLACDSLVVDEERLAQVFVRVSEPALVKDLLEFLRAAGLDAERVQQGLVSLWLAYDLDATAVAELRFSLKVWQLARGGDVVAALVAAPD